MSRLLTPRGWGLAASSPALAVAGRLLGLDELYLLAVAGLALCAGAAVRVRLGAPRVRVSRVLHPPRVQAGGASRVELEVANQGARGTPVLTVRDSFDQGWRWARFLVGPLGPGDRSRAAYRLPTAERGIFDVGPLEVSMDDPFGLAHRVVTTLGPTQLTVHPRIETVPPLPLAQGHDPRTGARHPRALLGTGDDFYALRPYEMGDDLRRVHWASTARVDDLMIRQDERPWQARSTILLDVRAGAHTPASLEQAVSAAASIHAAGLRSGALVRLVSTDGTDSGFGSGHAHAESVLEHLAVVDADPDDRLAAVVARLRTAGNGGALAVVTSAGAGAGDLGLVAGLRARFTVVVVVVVACPPDAPPPAPPGCTVVPMAPGAGLAGPWARALASAVPAGR